MKNTIITNEVPEKVPYTTMEKLAEILCGVLIAAACVVYIFLITRLIHPMSTVVSAALSAAVYGALTVFSVRPDFISKRDNPRKTRRVCIAVKIMITAVLLAARIIMTFTVEYDVFSWYLF